MMSSFSAQLMFLILQFLQEEQYKNTLHMLEQESSIFFNIEYFEELVLSGSWIEAERYFLGFTKLNENIFSVKVIFEIRKQKYLEALDKLDRVEALHVLTNDLEVFSPFNEGILNEMSQLLVLDNFRENNILSAYGGTEATRSLLLEYLKKLLFANPAIHKKLVFPDITKSRLRTLISQSDSLNCENLKENFDITTLFKDNQQKILLFNDPLSASATQQVQGCLSISGAAGPSSSSSSHQTHFTMLPNSSTETHLALCGTGAVAKGLEIPNEMCRESPNMVMQPAIGFTVAEMPSMNVPEFSEALQFRSLRLSAGNGVGKISRLTYTNKGDAILALGSNAIHSLWRWRQLDDINPSGMATAKVTPQFIRPKSGALMINDLTSSTLGEVEPCFALSKNDSYLVSASGGRVSLFNMITFRVMDTLMAPKPIATCVAFHPDNNNYIAVGMDDISIRIYNIQANEFLEDLRGHYQRITGLAFSQAEHLLVSSGRDAQIIIWKWKKDGRVSEKVFLENPVGRTPRTEMPASNTYVEFHQDQIHFLVVHETQLAIYETSKLERVKQWVVGESSAPITHATFSSDSESVFACFRDGTIRIFGTYNLRLQCQINPSGYLASGISGFPPYPLVIAAHPNDPNQFAVGLEDGGIQILEPHEL